MRRADLIIFNRRLAAERLVVQAYIQTRNGIAP